MATGLVRKTPSSLGADGTAAALRLGREGSGFVNDWIFGAALEGKLFVSGTGLEGTALTGQTSLADTTPSIMLKSPSGGGTIVAPLYFRALMTTEGDAAPDWYISLVTADVTQTGTAVTPQSTLGPNGQAAQASLMHTVTAGAFTDAQNVRLACGENTLDNLLSVEGVTTVILANDLQNSQSSIEWKAPAPILMKDGCSLCVHFSTGTAGSAYEWVLIHAELDAAAYV